MTPDSNANSATRFAWQARAFHVAYGSPVAQIHEIAELSGAADLSIAPVSLLNEQTRYLFAVVRQICSANCVVRMPEEVVLIANHTLVSIEEVDSSATGMRALIARLDMVAYHGFVYGALLIPGRKQINLGPVEGVQYKDVWELVRELLPDSIESSEGVERVSSR
ncbi:hypothetical protein [Paraburkholderia caribensis]|uniref:hypothetical protein n=1 Tax=Paraburkholderia caribensis TaxID=75105 RepID=UPI0015919489|nr:hypothetical protein [Paraburkholderia caribensis]